MITIDAVCLRFRELPNEEVERWITRDWVRPDGERGSWMFREIDVARIELILELRDGMRVGDEALPVVLSLIDQLYEERRRLRRIRDLIEAVPEPAREAFLDRLGGN